MIHNRAMQEEKDMKEIERKCLDDKERAQQKTKRRPRGGQEYAKRGSRGREQRYAR